jgi:hypothetical protein
MPDVDLDQKEWSLVERAESCCQRRGAADRGQRGEAAGAFAPKNRLANQGLLP